MENGRASDSDDPDVARRQPSAVAWLPETSLQAACGGSRGCQEKPGYTREPIEVYSHVLKCSMQPLLGPSNRSNDKRKPQGCRLMGTLIVGNYSRV